MPLSASSALGCATTGGREAAGGGHSFSSKSTNYKATGGADILVCPARPFLKTISLQHANRTESLVFPIPRRPHSFPLPRHTDEGPLLLIQRLAWYDNRCR